MFKRDDGTDLCWFSYINKDGDEESVALVTSSLVYIDLGVDICSIYKEDIPKLIKVLEAVYNHKN